MDDNKFDDFFEAKEDEELNNDVILNNNDLPNNKKNNIFKEKKKYFIIGGIVLVLILAVVLLLKFFNVGNSYNGYTAKVGDTLKVNEIGGIFNIKVLTLPEVYHSTERYFFKGDYLRIKASIENKDDSDLSLSLVSFKLVDSSKNEVADCNSFFPDTFPGILNSTLGPGESKNGYIYFEDDKDDNADGIVRQSTIDDAKYLEISIMAWVDKNAYQKEGKIITKNEQYYIAIK